MWIEICKSATDAVDANMKTIEALKAASGIVTQIDPPLPPGANLVLTGIRGIAFRANQLDTELRQFLINIQDEAKLEGEQ